MLFSILLHFFSFCGRFSSVTVSVFGEGLGVSGWFDDNDNIKQAKDTDGGEIGTYFHR